MSNKAQKSRLRDLIFEYFSLVEIKSLCFDIDINYDELSGDTLKLKIQELIFYCYRHDKIMELISTCESLRPQVNWRDWEDDSDKRYEVQNQKEYDDVKEYTNQITKRYESLDFVGIPELKDRSALRLRDVFIQLKAQANLDFLEYDYFKTSGMSLEKIRGISIGQAMLSNNRIVVLGDPGAGKTTLLKYIVLAFAMKQSEEFLGISESRLPIFVRLSEFVAKRKERNYDYSLIDYLQTQAKENLLLNLNPNFFTEALKNQNCCICFDGLDELGDVSLRKEIKEVIELFISRFGKGNRFILTSRIVGYNEAAINRSEFTHYTILPFADEDIKLFIFKWYKVRSIDAIEAKEGAQSLIDTILNEPRIRSLATNPLLLTIIALVHRIEAELPHERVKLYEKCVSALVDTWEKVKKIEIISKEKPLFRYRRRLLEQLAYWLHNQQDRDSDIRTIKLGTLRIQLADFLKGYPRLQLDEEMARQEANNFIYLARSRTGLLIEQGTDRGEEVYAFAHLTFQEYLAACDIRKRSIHLGVDAIWSEIKGQIHNQKWREVILLLLGSLNEYDELPDLVVKRIFETGQHDNFEPVLHRNLRLCARALADQVEVSINFRKKIVDALLEALKTNHIRSDRILESLRSIKNDNYVANGLLEITANTLLRPWIRGQAVLSLGELGRVNEAIIENLLTIAANKKELLEIRYNSAFALGRLGYVKFLPEILKDLEINESKIFTELVDDSVKFPPPTFEFEQVDAFLPLNYYTAEETYYDEFYDSDSEFHSNILEASDNYDLAYEQAILDWNTSNHRASELISTSFDDESNLQLRINSLRSLRETDFWDVDKLTVLNKLAALALDNNTYLIIRREASSTLEELLSSTNS